MRVGSTIGMLLIIASLLQGCIEVLALGAYLDHQDADRFRADIEKEIRARPVGDPGPVATVAMIPLGPPAHAVEQHQADSFRCEVHARMGGRKQGIEVSKATKAKQATERYVLCMAGYGYRCADHSENKTCTAAWTHPTATREQFLQDARECFHLPGLPGTNQSRYLKCMRSRGYRADVGDMGERRP